MTRRHLLPSLLLAGLVLLPPLRTDAADPAGSPDPRALWATANEDWFAGRYAAALQRYEALLDLGVDNASLRFDLGTAALRLERYGLAIHHLELAARADPSDGLARDIVTNLEVARAALLERDRDRIETGQLLFDPSLGVWPTLFTLLPRTLVLALALALAAAFCLSLAILGIRRLSALHGPARVVAWASLVPFALAATLAVGRLHTDRVLRPGVVVAPDAVLREVPSRSARGAPVAEGLQLRVLDPAPDAQGLLRVRIGDEREGWMIQDDLGLY
ncbi:MAG: hypothetical protein FJ098_00380 [Deltaproteobacteria bacterium]|nr:hypothetical protein [Deltaproteobacteria bacterium]